MVFFFFTYMHILLFPCSQLTGLRQKILDRRFAGFTIGLISYETDDLKVKTVTFAAEKNVTFRRTNSRNSIC